MGLESQSAAIALFEDDSARLLGMKHHRRGRRLAQRGHGRVAIAAGGRQAGLVVARQLILLGTQMDYKIDKLSSGFVFNNPNETSACGCGESVAITPASPEALGQNGA